MRDIVRWSAGAVSGLALFFGVFSLSLLNLNSVGAPDCLPFNSPDGCGPIVQQDIVALPVNSLELRFAIPLLALALVAGLPLWISIPIRAEGRGSSRRLLLMIVALCATGLLTVDIAILLSQIGHVGAPQVCLGDASGATFACWTGAQGALLALAGASGASLVGALLAGTPAWVMALVQTARWRRWGWFAAVLLFSPIAALLYAGFGPSQPMRSAAARSTPAVAPAL